MGTDRIKSELVTFRVVLTTRERCWTTFLEIAAANVIHIVKSHLKRLKSI